MFSMKPARWDPKNWETIFMMPEPAACSPFIISAMVTAGLYWAPVIPPPQQIIMKSTKPCENATLIS